MLLISQNFFKKLKNLMAAVFYLIPVLIIIIIAHVPKCSLNPYQPNLAYYFLFNTFLCPITVVVIIIIIIIKSANQVKYL